MKNKSWCIMAALVALTLLATATRLSAQDWKGEGRVFGRVVDDNGKPVPNAVVKLRLQQAGNEGPETKTDKNGEFSVVSIRGGTWIIETQAPGFLGDKSSFTLPAGEGRIPPLEVKLKKDVAGEKTKQLQAQVAKGDELMKQGKFADARAEYEKVLAAQPDLSSLHGKVAITYGREGNYQAALKELDAVLEKQPNEPALLQLAATTAMQMGDAQRAQQYLSRIDMTKVNDPAPMVNLAITALNKNQPQTAVLILDPVVNRFPQAPDPYYFRALAELQLQQMDKAKADLQKFIPLAPPDSKEAQQAKEMLAQIKEPNSASTAAPASGQPFVNQAGAIDAAPVYQLRR